MGGASLEAVLFLIEGHLERVSFSFPREKFQDVFDSFRLRYGMPWDRRGIQPARRFIWNTTLGHIHLQEHVEGKTYSAGRFTTAVASREREQDD